VLLALMLVFVTGSAASGQVFLAAEPHPAFMVGPLIVSASVPQDLGPVQVNLSWSLSVPTGPPPRRQDLVLLWPREIAAATLAGDADSEVARYVEGRGMQVLSTGRLALRWRDQSRVGTGNLGDPLDVSASYATFIRAGFPHLGGGTYIKIPWSPQLAEPHGLLTLGLPLKGMIAPKPAGWFAELFWGRRYIVTSSFGDVGQITLSLFPLYFERRDHVVRVAREFSLMTLNFPDAEHLRIEEISPATATRRSSRVRAGTETVSLLLPGGDALSSHVLRVEFNYFTGRIAWRPILVSLALLAIGNLMGTIMLGQSIGNLVRRTFWLARGGTPPARRNGAVIAPETLRGIQPGSSTHADVVKLCGVPQEERQRLGGHRTLVYRGNVLITHRRFAWGWLGTVRYREVEHHEAVIDIENDRVRDVEARVSRSRAE
jgi:hypothetical protein